MILPVLTVINWNWPISNVIEGDARIGTAESADLFKRVSSYHHVINNQWRVGVIWITIHLVLAIQMTYNLNSFLVDNRSSETSSQTLLQLGLHCADPHISHETNERNADIWQADRQHNKESCTLGISVMNSKSHKGLQAWIDPIQTELVWSTDNRLRMIYIAMIRLEFDEGVDRDSRCGRRYHIHRRVISVIHPYPFHNLHKQYNQGSAIHVWLLCCWVYLACSHSKYGNSGYS